MLRQIIQMNLLSATTSYTGDTSICSSKRLPHDLSYLSIISKMLEAIVEACKDDDPALVSQKLEDLTAIYGSRTVWDRLSNANRLDEALNTAVYLGAVKVMSDLISRGADIHLVRGFQVTKSLSSSQTIEVLKVLVAHSWGINQSNDRSPGIMWSFVDDGDLLGWCLANGASLRVGDTPTLRPRSDWRRSDTILERTASCGIIQTFEFLRKRGAPVGTRALQAAVQAATVTQPRHDREVHGEALENLTGRARAKTYTERFAMVRHLVEVVKLDVNASDILDSNGKRINGRWGTPLEYIFEGGLHLVRDNTDLIMYLVGRGADATMALDWLDWCRAADPAIVPRGTEIGADRLEHTIRALEDWMARPKPSRWRLSEIWRRYLGPSSKSDCKRSVDLVPEHWNIKNKRLHLLRTEAERCLPRLTSIRKRNEHG